MDPEWVVGFFVFLEGEHLAFFFLAHALIAFEVGGKAYLVALAEKKGDGDEEAGGFLFYLFGAVV